jgi:hypothetical protein
MNLTTEQTTKLDSFVNDLGDHFAKDLSDLKMHEAFIVIRKELTDCAPKLKELRSHADWALFRAFLDFCDRTLDRIESRRRSTIAHMQGMLLN